MTSHKSIMAWGDYGPGSVTGLWSANTYDAEDAVKYVPADLTPAAVAAALEGAAALIESRFGAAWGARAIRALITQPQRDALQAVIYAAKAEGYLDGYGAAISDVEAMRASDGILRGKSLIVTGLKISLTKMTASQIGAKP